MFFRTDSIIILRGKKNKVNKLKSVKSSHTEEIRGVTFEDFCDTKITFSLPGHISDAHLRNLSYRCPEATEKMLITSSLSCFGSSVFPPPVNPLKETQNTSFLTLNFEINLKKTAKSLTRRSQLFSHPGTWRIQITS